MDGLKTDQGSYWFVDAHGQRLLLSVGFLGTGGGLVVKVKKTHPHQPLPSRFETDLPLEDTEHPDVAA